jgi:hypothetical protein
MVVRSALRSRMRCQTSALCALAVMLLVGVPKAHAIDEAALLAYRQSFANEMCKDGGSWLRCFQVDPANCNSVLGAIIERCTRLITEKQLPPAQNQDQAKAVSNKIVKCVEKDFGERYDAFKLNTEECRKF